ncbi:rod shape-determining protein MreC [Paenibacillus endoradicis]|uniref:rod shape-determining protein MreC n=1 Tax=Paenibacillus endoradicis TaxID=2972487 RepID=UPI002159B18B|nr:rod shape-determining protein MreC [Paenibacillus endoradicis]MCR8655705.1 rod shape-determining protein MreC [Paenibacillus endoradicis]MCR8658031.1 rod shape-determining protein MreC [Paenibacillus endoradicis]
MFNFLKNKRLFMLMIGFLIFIVMIGLSIGGRQSLTWPEKFLKDAVGGIQQMIYRPAGAIAGFFQDMNNLSSIYEENEQLRMLASAYARDKVEYNFTKNKNIELQEALDFTSHQKEMYDYTYMIAQVISVSNDANNRTININVGSKQGVQKDMAVVTVDGLVGLVKAVTPFTASVTPYTELNSLSTAFNAISATVLDKETESFGILTDYDAELERITMTKIGENDPIADGDTVITSGFGNIYPRGLQIGTVESLNVGDAVLTYQATIKPFVDLNQLTEVFVVKIPQINEDEELTP